MRYLLGLYLGSFDCRCRVLGDVEARPGDIDLAGGVALPGDVDDLRYKETHVC